MMIVRRANFHKKSLIRHHGSIMINNLPDELLIEILLRVAEAKSVIRCKLVRKKWYVIISTTSFIRRFLNHNSAAADYGKISHFVPQSHKRQLDYFPAFILRGEEEICTRDIDLYNFNVIALYNFNVIASCNDLLLCRLGSETEYCICNPLTRQYTTLPPSPKLIRSTEEEMGTTVVVGFSCDSYVKKNREGQVTFNPDYTYRVVLLYNCYGTDGLIIHEFSSETNEWRDCIIIPSLRNYFSVPIYYVGMSTMIVVKGLWYWIASFILQICIYNPQNFTMRAISVPSPNSSGLGKPVLGVCGGFLRYFTLINRTQYPDEKEIIITAKVWELDQDGKWNLVHCVCLQKLGHLWHSGFTKRTSRRRGGIYYNISALAIDPNDADIIYIKVGKDHNIVSCNLREMEMKHIQVPFAGDSTPGIRLSFRAFPVMAPLWPTPIRLAN